MPIAVEVAQDGQELWIVASGRIGFEDIRALGRAMASDPRSDLAEARVVDLREAELDLFLDDIREVLASVCGHPDRSVAIVAPAGAVFGIARQMESVAVGQGRRFKTFADLAKALAWIRASPRAAEAPAG